MDSCFQYGQRRTNAFVYDHASGATYLANQNDGRRIGVGSDRPVIDANCSSMTFRHYTDGLVTEQVYWRELPAFPKTEPPSGKWLHLGMPTCESIDASSIQTYSFVEGETLKLSSSGNNIGLSVYSSDDFSEESLICDSFEQEGLDDSCVLGEAFRQSDTLYAAVDTTRSVVDATPDSTSSYTLLLEGKLQFRTLNATNPGSAAISDDGRYVAFTNSDDDLLPADTNDDWDVYRQDTVTGGVSIVSTGGESGESDGTSYQPSISGDGSVVGFFSTASNIGLFGETRNRNGIYVATYDDDGIRNLNSISNNASGDAFNGNSGDPKVSGDGRSIAFTTVANNVLDVDGNGAFDDFPGPANSPNVFSYDLPTTDIEAVSVDADGVLSPFPSSHPSISSDGRFVAFSTPSKLHPLDTNDLTDIYVRDRVANVTAIATLTRDGGSADGFSTMPRISPDGQWLVFESLATNLTRGDDNGAKDVFLADISNIHTEQRTEGAETSDGDSADSGDDTGVIDAPDSTGESDLEEADSGGTADSVESDVMNDDTNTSSTGGGGCTIASGQRDLSSICLLLFAVAGLCRRRLSW